MSSAQIQALLSPPNANDSARRATEALNKQFTTIEDLHVLDVLVAEADDRNRAAQAKVRTTTFAFFMASNRRLLVGKHISARDG